MTCGGGTIPEFPRVSTTISVASPPTSSSAKTPIATNFPPFFERFSGA
jgi:hypothetical protein